MREQGYALVEHGRLVRFSFSRSLLEYLRATYRPGADLVRAGLLVGRRLRQGETSRTGLYGILTSKTAYPLRITQHSDLALELTQCPSRCLAEVELIRLEQL